MKKPHYLLQFFTYAHLPAHLQEISKPFCEAAEAIDDLGTYPGENALVLLLDTQEPMQDVARKKILACLAIDVPNNIEKLVSFGKLWIVYENIISKDFALRCLLEAKDAGVRAKLFKD